MKATQKKTMKHVLIGLGIGALGYYLYDKSQDKKYPNRPQGFKIGSDLAYDGTNILRKFKGMESLNTDPTLTSYHQ